mmetsp:Transcript_48499/g.85518  ORF Transcript_48499/g.85518 Transcript_48499/m.85518 type:complete len:82 (+) Transcript_48499:312-557(+)
MSPQMAAAKVAQVGRNCAYQPAPGLQVAGFGSMKQSALKKNVCTKKAVWQAVDRVAARSILVMGGTRLNCLGISCSRFMMV